MVAALALVVGGLCGYLIGDSVTNQSSTSVVAVSDGTPPSTAELIRKWPLLTLLLRVAEITRAFHDAFDGGTSQDAKEHAMQDGAALRQLRRSVDAFAKEHGYTSAQLAGTTITILDTNFIDETHAAAVRFTIAVPERGNVIVDRVRYAVVDSHHWKVALRTACDLLSLDGLIGPAPANPLTCRHCAPPPCSAHLGVVPWDVVDIR